MPIVALSDSAARAICSTLVLNDAISVIKELIDNALDSHASNITIEISANTLDIIQVKDNGGGIGVEDRQLLCKRGFTSKIRTLEDLSQLGGTFLGFRGEALASVAELSDGVTITTRIDGETVGTLLKYDSSGKLISSASAAHGTGTTVRVSDFLKSIPVRKQTALKQSTKTYNAIKKLLFDYAFARPTVRFHFKILKSGGDLKANWSFLPCADASNLNLLTSKIVGKEVSAQCKQLAVKSDDGEYTIDALLYAQGLDITKCAGTERFVSIDGRPLAVERGLLKDMTKIYKSYVSQMLPEGMNVPNKTFLLLRFQCPRGSYDVNIEPAKNEVMFEDPGLVLDLFERLCKTAYGEKLMQQKAKKDLPRKPNDQPVDFGILLAPKTAEEAVQNEPQSDLSDPELSRNQESASNGSPISGQAKTFDNMFDPDDEEPDVLADESHSVREVEIAQGAEDIMNPNITNPFTLAKLNTLVKPTDLSPREGATLTPGHRATQNVIALSADTGAGGAPALEYSYSLPSPSPSPVRNVPYQNPGPPNRPWKTRQNRQESDEDGSSSLVAVTNPTASTKPTLLERWTTSMNASSSRGKPSDMIEVRRSEPILIHDCTNQPARNDLPTRSPSKNTVGSSSGQRTTFRTPFKKNPVLQSRSPASSDHSSGPSVRQSAVQIGTPVSPVTTEKSTFATFERPKVPLGTELDEIMDFEHRKRSMVLEHRKRAKRSRSEATPTDEEGTEEDSRFSLPSRTEREGVERTGQNASYGSKFGKEAESGEDDIPPQPNSAGYTQNPHTNRYRKAIRDLEGRDIVNGSTSSDSETAQAGTDARLNNNGTRQQQAKMSLRDPRAYLIRQVKSNALQSGTGGQKKLSTMKLPFEKIHAGLETYTQISIMDLEDTGDIKMMNCRTEALSKIDPYVRQGVIHSDAIEGILPPDILQELENKMQDLTRENQAF